MRQTSSGVGPYLDALTDIAVAIGMTRVGTDASGSIVNAKFDADATDGPTFRIKIEINIAEIESFQPRAGIPYSVDSPWWHGEAVIGTFALAELLGTKLRALYQRSKGRDLFDLWLALTQLNPRPAEVVAAFRHYIGDDEFTFPELARNLEAKLEDREFSEDLLQLVVSPPDGYDPADAADLVISELGTHLRNAPTPEQIGQRGWKL